MNRGECDFVIKRIDFQDLAVTIDKTLENVKKMGANINQRRFFLILCCSPKLKWYPKCTSRRTEKM